MIAIKQTRLKVVSDAQLRWCCGRFAGLRVRIYGDGFLPMLIVTLSADPLKGLVRN